MYVATLTHYPDTYANYMATDGHAGLFLQRNFADLVIHFSTCGATAGHACGAKLLPMTVLAYPVDCICFCHLLKAITNACMCPNGQYNLPLAAHPPTPPTTPPSYPVHACSGIHQTIWPD